jgi:hypothetical protein
MQLKIESAPGVVTVRQIVETHAGHWYKTRFFQVTALQRKLASIEQQVIVVKKRDQISQ